MTLNIFSIKAAGSSKGHRDLTAPTSCASAAAATREERFIIENFIKHPGFDSYLDPKLRYNCKVVFDRAIQEKIDSRSFPGGSVEDLMRFWCEKPEEIVTKVRGQGKIASMFFLYLFFAFNSTDSSLKELWTHDLDESYHSKRVTRVDWAESYGSYKHRRVFVVIDGQNKKPIIVLKTYCPKCNRGHLAHMVFAEASVQKSLEILVLYQEFPGSIQEEFSVDFLRKKRDPLQPLHFIIKPQHQDGSEEMPSGGMGPATHKDVEKMGPKMSGTLPPPPGLAIQKTPYTPYSTTPTWPSPYEAVTPYTYSSSPDGYTSACQKAMMAHIDAATMLNQSLIKQMTPEEVEVLRQQTVGRLFPLLTMRNC